MDSYFSHAGSTFTHEYTQSSLNGEILRDVSIFECIQYLPTKTEARPLFANHIYTQQK